MAWISIVHSILWYYDTLYLLSGIAPTAMKYYTIISKINIVHCYAKRTASFCSTSHVFTLVHNYCIIYTWIALPFALLSLIMYAHNTLSKSLTNLVLSVSKTS